MADKSREQQKTSPLTTVLDPLRPAVVVRRRVTVVENAGVPRGFSTERATFESVEDEDENGPPSSVNVARALASLRADELKRVEDLLNADDAEEEQRQSAEAAEVAPPPPAPPPTLHVGKTVSLSKLADQMGMQAKDLTATLVASGFYSLHAKTTLTRETAQTIAEMFGWQVAPLSEEPKPHGADSAEATDAPSEKRGARTRKSIPPSPEGGGTRRAKRTR